MTKTVSKKRVSAALLLATFGVAAASSPVHAYNEKTHQTTTKIAFDIMRLVAHERAINQSMVSGQDALATPPDGIDPAEWQQFIAAIDQGTYRILGQDSGLPDYGACTGVQGLRMHELPPLDGENMMEYHFQYLDKERDGKNKCTQAQYKRGPLFQQLNQAFPRGVMAGSALGVHAAAPDRYDHDWYVFHDPFQVGGAGLMWDHIDRGTSILIGAFAAPIFCLVKLFKGDGLCSRDDIKDFSDRANPVPQVRGVVNAAFSLFSFKIPGDWGTGIGHLMNYSPSAQNVHDDIEGFHQERSGWRGRPGLTDLMIMLAGDTLGLCIDPVDSDGARAYEICDGSRNCGTNEVLDDHSASKRRTNPYWRSSTLGHTAFTPLDNLAYYGWHKALNPNFPEPGPPVAIRVHADELARPLHALGDIAAPHHLIAGLGWGHRIYEPMVEEFWERLQTIDNPEATLQEQYAQARSILKRAFVWHRFILASRAEFDSQYDNDIPIRDMISEMGARNYSYILSGNEMTYANFHNKVPFADHPFRAFPFVDRVHRDGTDDDKRVVESWLDDDKERIEWLLDSATAGTLAFLTSAADWMEPMACGDGMVTPGETCDDDNAVDGDGCSAQCQVEAGFECDDAWPSECTTSCGDGVVADEESCDDDNARGGDGCSAQCQPEAGWTCNGASPSICSSVCGDGLVRGGESCDDGDLQDDDGCNAQCRPEPGWTCNGGSPTSCWTTCGDGIVAGDEQCELPGSAACDSLCRYIVI
jgi:cysteine-rich repeat protein